MQNSTLQIVLKKEKSTFKQKTQIKFESSRKEEQKNRY